MPKSSSLPFQTQMYAPTITDSNIPMFALGCNKFLQQWDDKYGSEVARSAICPRLGGIAATVGALLISSEERAHISPLRVRCFLPGGGSPFTQGPCWRCCSSDCVWTGKLAPGAIIIDCLPEYREKFSCCRSQSAEVFCFWEVHERDCCLLELELWMGSMFYCNL